MFLSKMVSMSFVVGLMFSCSANIDKEGLDKKDKAPEIDTTQTVNVPVSLEDRAVQLSLAPATAYSISVEDCLSGYTGTATHETVEGLTLYKFDQNCRAKLTTFMANGISYAVYNPGATSFMTWAVNDSATFTDASGVYSIQVTVTAQVSSPVQTSDTVGYAFSEIAIGSAYTISANKVQEGRAVSIGGDLAPNFSVYDVTFSGVNLGGAGNFQFNLECKVVQNGTPACDEVPLAATSYALVEDIYGGFPSVGDLSTLFPGFSSNVDINNNVLGTGVTPNSRGGFTTAAVSGPSQMHIRPQMLLVLKHGASYQYFEVDVAVIPVSQ